MNVLYYRYENELLYSHFDFDFDFESADQLAIFSILFIYDVSLVCLRKGSSKKYSQL